MRPSALLLLAITAESRQTLDVVASNGEAAMSPREECYAFRPSSSTDEQQAVTDQRTRTLTGPAFISTCLACIVNITIPRRHLTTRGSERGINESLRLPAAHVDGGYRQ